MHRDIKPSNILVNSRGNIKLCDFGVATETVNSIADTFVGTSTYMAPERIQGGAYTVRSDVWSVGLTVMELAVGRFPFDSSDSSAGDRASAGPMGILDLLQQIVHEPAPKLPKSDAFPPILHEFVAKCLLKKSEERPTPRELYVCLLCFTPPPLLHLPSINTSQDKDAFLQAAKRTPVDLQEWAISMMERHNRKSYLAPPPPKSLKEEQSSKSKSKSGSGTPGRTPPYSSPRAPEEIPVNMVPDRPAYRPSTQSPRPMRSARSPPRIALEHLSLETREDDGRSGRRPSRHALGDSVSSAVGSPGHVSRGSRSSSHNPHARLPLQTSTLPVRAAPPPSGPPPPPPTSSGSGWSRGI